MGQRKVRFEFTDDDGGNYSVTLEGTINKEKLLKLTDMMELMSGEESLGYPNDTAYGKICETIENTFPLGLFTSNDILEAYEDTYNTPVKISTVSTYLSRLTNKGLLRRQRNGDSWVYRRITSKINR